MLLIHIMDKELKAFLRGLMKVKKIRGGVVAGSDFMRVEPHYTEPEGEPLKPRQDEVYSYASIHQLPFEVAFEILYLRNLVEYNWERRYDQKYSGFFSDESLNRISSMNLDNFISNAKDILGNRRINDFLPYTMAYRREQRRQTAPAFPQQSFGLQAIGRQ